MTSFNLAFIGLGVMGYPMAGHLARAGHRVRVFNRTSAKAESWIGDHPGESAETPAKAAEGADFAFSCVGNDADLAEVVFGSNGILAGLAPGAALVDHTTASAGIAREIEAAAGAQSSGFLDAPVSGGQAGAENGTLTVMAGGQSAVFERARPVIDVYAQAVALMGPAGAGQLTKMANQICIAGLVQGLAEGLNFATRAGLDGKQVLDVISKGAAQSWQMENRGETMIDDQFDFGFAVDWMCKDLDIALGEGAKNGSHLPLTALVGQFYRRLQRQGGGRWDTSSLIRLLSREN